MLKTLYLFEEPDTLGRAVRWAFDGSQLLVVPRAGEWGNAFYERESRSLQLFYVKPDARHTIYACHSMDILAHETAHAVLDGIAPDLYDSLLPESLALHEAVADLTTLLMAFGSRKLAEHVLAQTGGTITSPQRLHRDRRAVRRRHPSGPGGPAQPLQRSHHDDRGHRASRTR